MRVHGLIIVVNVLLTIILSGCIAEEEIEDPCYNSFDQPDSPGFSGYMIYAGYCHSLPIYEKAIHSGIIQSANTSEYSLISFDIETFSKDRYVPYAYGGAYLPERERYLERDNYDDDLRFHVNYDCFARNIHANSGDNHPNHYSNYTGIEQIRWGNIGNATYSGYNTFWEKTVNADVPAGYYAGADCDFEVVIFDSDIRDYLGIGTNESFEIAWRIEIEYYGDPNYATCPERWPFYDHEELEYHQKNDSTIYRNWFCDSGGDPQNEYGESFLKYRWSS